MFNPDAQLISQKCICYVEIKLYIQFAALGPFIAEKNPVDLVVVVVGILCISLIQKNLGVMQMHDHC